MAIIIATLALGFYALNAFHFGGMPLRIEESEWPPMGAAILDTGKPIIAADETYKVRFSPTLQPDPSPIVGAWHPPLYLYTLAASMAVVGSDASNALRAVGVAGLLASGLLLLLIAKEVTPRWRLVGGASAVLLLIHPYAIQASLFLDIDTSIYPPLALLVIWLAIRFGSRDLPLSLVQVVVLGATLALLAWAKLTTTIILVGVLAAWWLLSRRPVLRAAVEVVAVMTAGATLFAVTYALWCSWAGIPFAYTFDVTFVQKSDRLLSEWWLTENAAHWHLRWFGAGIFILSLAYLIDMVRNFIRTGRPRALDLLYLFGIGVLINYVALSPTDGTYQGKYAMPAMVALPLPLMWMLMRTARSTRAPLGRWIAAAATAVVAALLAPDVLTNLAVNGEYGNWYFDLLVIVGAALALAAAWLLGGRRGFGGGVVLVLSLLLVAQGLHSYGSGHSPLYPVPDTQDFRAGAADLNAMTEAGDIVVAPKDLGFYVDGSVVEGEDAFARGDALLAEVMKTNRRVAAFASDSFGPPVGPETRAVVDECFLTRRSFGSVSLAYRSGTCR